MWAGTPYELMMPVDAHAMVVMGEMGGMAAATPSP
jgi:hypothetical protein